MAFYDELQDLADELLTEFGKSAKVIRSTSEPADSTSWDPGASAETPTEVDVTLAVTGYTLTDRSDSRIEAGDLVGLISAKGLAFELDPQDGLEVDGVDYRFVDLVPLKPAGVVVVYEFIARR